MGSVNGGAYLDSSVLERPESRFSTGGCKKAWGEDSFHNVG